LTRVEPNNRGTEVSNNLRFPDLGCSPPRPTTHRSGHLGRPEASPVRLPLQSPSPSIRRRRRSGAGTRDGGRSFPGPPSRRPHQLSSPPPLGRALVRVRPDLARSALQVRRPPLQQTPPPISLLNGYHVVLLPCSPDLLPASLRLTSVGVRSRGGVRCRDRPLLLIGERGHLSQASALLSPLSCLARGGCRYPRSQSFPLPVLAVAVMPAHHLAAASVNLHQRRRRAPPMGHHQRCRPHRRRCKPSGSQSPAMGGRLAAVQKLGKDTGMTILCFF